MKFKWKDVTGKRVYVEPREQWTVYLARCLCGKATRWLRLVIHSHLNGKNAGIDGNENLIKPLEVRCAKGSPLVGPGRTGDNGSLR